MLYAHKIIMPKSISFLLQQACYFSCYLLILFIEAYFNVIKASMIINPFLDICDTFYTEQIIPLFMRFYFARLENIFFNNLY